MTGQRSNPNHWWICDDCGLCTCPCCNPYCRCHDPELGDGAMLLAAYEFVEARSVPRPPTPEPPAHRDGYEKS